MPGVTDQDSINDWDLPFQLKREISKEDDLYWNNYRLTPKAFLSLENGKRLFGSRFGSTTGLRLSVDAADNLDALERRLLEILRPIRDESRLVCASDTLRPVGRVAWNNTVRWTIFVTQFLRDSGSDTADRDAVSARPGRTDSTIRHVIGCGLAAKTSIATCIGRRFVGRDRSELRSGSCLELSMHGSFSGRCDPGGSGQ